MKHLIWETLVLLLPSVAQAACIPVDTSAWTQDQKNQLQAVTYELAFLAGHDEVPTLTPGQVCFATFDPTGVMDANAILARYASDEALRQAARTAFLNEQATAQQELQTNTLCSGNLADLDAKIDAGVATITDLASAKTFLAIFLKRVARCVRANAELGR